MGLRTRNSKGLIAACMMVVALAAQPVVAQSFSDAQIKAVYIVKLGKFISWNGQKRSPINFCYMESSRTSEDASVGQNLEKFVKGKGLSGEWKVTHVRGSDTFNDCEILFIADSEESSLQGVLAKTDGQDILTVSDVKRFIFKDGMLGFALDDQSRVKMEANLKNIRKTKVQVSAQVLEFMQQVIK